MTSRGFDFSHLPVLYEAALEGLSIRSDGLYVDCTAGGGGHSEGILRRLGPRGRLIALDRDPMAIAVSLFPRFTGNFRVAKYWLRLGELLERLRLGSKLHATQQKTSTWLAQLSTGKIEVEN